MRTILLFITSLILCAIFYTKAPAHPTLKVQVSLDKAEEVELLGELLSSKTKSLITYKPIRVMQYSNQLNVDFLSNLGNIEIQIYDNYRTLIYNGVINTQVLNQKKIDNTFLGYGGYSIRFVNSQGQYMHGSFVIKE